MANTLTGLMGSLYAALDVISRESIGFVPAVGMNSSAARASVGETVSIPLVGAANVSNVTPAMSIPEPTDQTVTNTTIGITKARAAEFGFVGEEQLGLDNGAGYNEIQMKMILQGMRSLVNEIETDLALLYKTTANAYGAATTNPFASNLASIAQAHKIMVDNGSPITDKQMVIDTTAGAGLRSLTQLTNVDNAGTAELLRNGNIGRLQGFAVRESGLIAPHTAGTASGATTDAAGYAVGATVITLASAGTGTIVAGDVITFAGDTNKYVVASGDADVSNGGTITLAKPGLKETVTGVTAITVTATYTPNCFFDRNAIQLAMRAPALPREGDMALDRIFVSDPVSGLGFEVSIYGGYRKVRYELAAAWGVKNIKPEHTGILIG